MTRTIRLVCFDLGGVLYSQTLTVSADGTLLAAIPAAAGQTLKVFRIDDLATGQ